ncbi:MAG: uroporphyrinogen decarboxylase family protein [Fibrobacterota bacterium]
MGHRGPLTRQEVINAIERKGGTQTPLVMHKWWGQGLSEKYGVALESMAAKYPDDIFNAWHIAPGDTESPNKNPSYRWGYKKDYSSAVRHSIGHNAELLPDWSELNQLLDDFPDPGEPGAFDRVEQQLPTAAGRYRLGGFWRVFHERFWGIRGMENLMLDYYDHMDKLQLLGRRLLDFHKGTVDRYAALGFDGIFTSDDLGHQRGPMMSPEVFRELYFPLYREFINHVHSKKMHVFLHSCGDNTLLLPMLIEAGLDVFHPVQKGCMDEAATARKFGNRISFLAGFDVQHTLPEGTPENVRREVRFLKETFIRKNEGGLLLAAGNGILADTPLANIEAMLNEMAR